MIGRWDIANRSMDPTVVEPVDPFQRGKLQIVETALT
jgi:hypothetical protein